VKAFSKRAESLYDENLSAYVKIVLRRPFAKIHGETCRRIPVIHSLNDFSCQDYFDGVERLLKTTAPSEVSSNSGYNRSSLKKIVKEYSGRTCVSTSTPSSRGSKNTSQKPPRRRLRKRVVHRSWDSMVGVWKACEEELLRMTENFIKRISQCYADSNVTLEYSAADVEAAFKRQRVGS